MEIAQKGRWAVTTLFFVNGLVTGAWAVQIAQLVSRFHITDKVIGHLILIFGLGALFMMPLSGMAMEKYGSQRIVRIFSIAASPALIPVGLAPDIYLLTPILFFLGAMIGAMNVAMNSNAVAVEKALSRTVLSSCHCFWSIGLFTSGLIGGYLVKQFGFLTHLFLIGTFSLAITLSVCPHVIKDKSIRIKRSIKEKQPHHSSTIYVIGVIALLAMIPECAVVDWSSRYLLKNLNATTETASLAFACFAGTMAIFRFLGDFIRNRFDAIFVMRTSSLVAGIGLLAAAAANTPWQATVGFAIAGIGIANLVPIAFSAAGNQPDISTNAGMGIVTTIGYLGTLLAPAPVGLVAELTGFPVVYIGMAAMMGVIMLLAPLVRVKPCET
ncbi:MFS transporter [Citrobacter braakii]|uniref:MFS transporter n=1 Tax=Citrobacter braakii TaxID=57706 RepID=UPI001903E03D|nr:MFS transporter [Citrobacter braakii]MBJ9143369.1 MFS transporter [Citrobacter braakii]